MDRRILDTIVKTKVVDFESLGKMVTAVGPGSAALEDDGWTAGAGAIFASINGRGRASTWKSS